MYEKPDKIIPALYGGLIIGLISSIPFLNFINCLCCAGIMLGGVLAIFFYKENFTPETPPFTAGDCMTVGVFAGLVGAISGTILSYIFMLAFGIVMGEYILQLLRQMDLQLPEESWEMIKNSLEESWTVGGIILNLVFSLILNSIFGMLGGLIGYNIFKPKPTAIQPPYQQNV
jgi:hypothetical protein